MCSTLGQPQRRNNIENSPCSSYANFNRSVSHAKNTFLTSTANYSSCNGENYVYTRLNKNSLHGARLHYNSIDETGNLLQKKINVTHIRPFFCSSKRVSMCQTSWLPSKGSLAVKTLSKTSQTLKIFSSYILP